MAVFRTISNSFWTDSKVDDTFTPEDKYFYLYLLTNPHTNICGCYEISNKQMSRETGYNEDTIKRLIERFEKVHDVIRYNPDTKEMLILNWHKYNWTKSEKLKTAVEKVIGHIKCQEYAEYIHATLYDDTVSIPYRYGMDTNIVSSPIVSNTNTNHKKKEFSKVLEDVPEEMREAVEAFIEMRKRIKSPLTEYALKRIITKTNKLADGDIGRCIEILDQSTENGWKGVYPLKQETPKAKEGRNDWIDEVEYTGNVF